MEPYPTRAHRTHTTAEAVRAFAGAADEKVAVVVAGRLRSIRDMGKASFAHLEDRAGQLQLYLKADDVGVDAYRLFQEAFDLGDFVEAAGFMFRTRTGEISLHVESFRMLAKALSPLPAAKEEVVDGVRVVHHAFANPEARYRERSADLAVTPDVREVFLTRARVVAALREFLDGMDFVEVETPVLQPLYGGAAARPFVTHHDQLHQDLYLRISFELYLKRLLVGGIERVYEIGRDFRNEGVSFKHNPEFTQLEFYMAYADYLQVMDLTEQMVCGSATGARRCVPRPDHRPDSPWRRIGRRAIGKCPIDIADFAGPTRCGRKCASRPVARRRRNWLVAALTSSGN
jgi:lysyl-tRNA synthetase class 2